MNNAKYPSHANVFTVHTVHIGFLSIITPLLHFSLLFTVPLSIDDTTDHNRIFRGRIRGKKFFIFFLMYIFKIIFEFFLIQFYHNSQQKGKTSKKENIRDAINYRV